MSYVTVVTDATTKNVVKAVRSTDIVAAFDFIDLWIAKLNEAPTLKGNLLIEHTEKGIEIFTSVETTPKLLIFSVQIVELDIFPIPEDSTI